MLIMFCAELIIPKILEIEFKFEPEIVKTGTFIQNLNLGFLFYNFFINLLSHFRKTGYPWE